MGFFKKLTKVISAPIRIPVKAITGTDPFTDFVGTVKAVPKGLGNIATFPLKAGQAIAQKAAGAGPQAGGVIFIPGQAQPINAPPVQTAPIPRGGIQGGPAAFSSFSPFSSSGRNPAWDFSQGSQARSVPSAASPVSSLGRWQVSGTSVRLLG